MESDSKERKEFVTAFTGTMVDIWREKLTLLKVWDTGALYRSVSSAYPVMDQEVTSVSMKFEFRDYGTFVERGTGRETPRGNPGDIGRAKVRRPRPWLNRKYYGSKMNLRDFFAESFSLQYIAIVDEALTK